MGEVWVRVKSRVLMPPHLNPLPRWGEEIAIEDKVGVILSCHSRVGGNPVEGRGGISNYHG